MKNGFLLMACIAALIFSCDKQKTTAFPDDTTTVAPNECNQRIIHASVSLKKDYVDDFINAAKTIIDSSNMEPG